MIDKIEKIKAPVYFLGIGGIGMSALARYFNSRGHKVSGYDRTESELTKQLVKEGMIIHYDDNISLVEKNAALVIYTPAIPVGHSEFNFLKTNGFTIIKRSEALGLITENKLNICVAGTHGKTTTSAMVAHILRDSGFGCNAFLGGIATNYNSNFWSSEKNVCVAEADEYDRSFLKLTPDVAVITAMDADHLDIYGTEKNMQDAFIEFTQRIKPGGLLIHKQELARSKEFKAGKTWTYGARKENADSFAQNVTIQNGAYKFDVTINKQTIKNVELNMGGRHNIENTVAAIAIARYLDIDEKKIKSAVSSFQGVKRRFEYVLKNNRHILIDDYAHHPEELRALITSAKELYPGKKCTIVFQPHLYSRTRDLADGFAEVLAIADEVVLLPIYPARELPVEGVNSEMILSKMNIQQKIVVSKTGLLELLKKNETELLITAGAGDIDLLLAEIKSILVNNN
ncbi:MAG: UDP-N-acetylmuramate--L-alanine ligase [Chitinophagaceae bacterium]|nr:UDP-N-acetylmuramate--L-alanine ligase [Chitinophagaceae bacterium]MBP6047410.1 UDP-N-acetylmuramate--L-alanine ligase [Ferruginibacter sp.]MBK7345957.1 UDP-N-acetylmuramate--L-alanine ligase [Chitinophagaceae bacterium]MBK8930335.1 UDP-N-acetylmuramate--L-alanine ligase [Chitinophagaceae bacterium]MBK9958991.1 UDP-N-acetylmuramate--L-alanine ligase [Chitinophagaceae bacterium]